MRPPLPILVIVLAAMWAAGCGWRAKSAPEPPPAPPPAVADIEPASPIETPPPTPPPPMAGEPVADPLDRPLARVNGGSIPVREFSLGYPAYRKALNFPPDTPQLRAAYLDRLIAEKLLEQEAGRRGLNEDPEFVRRISDAKREVIEEALLDQAVSGIANVSDDEIKAYYEQNRAQYAQPEIVQARNISTYTRDGAEQARQRILRGEPFAEVAAAVSIHPSRANGGALPAFSRGTYSDAFEEKAFSLRIGEVSEVFQTDLGWHVIEKTGETPERITPLENVKEEIRALLTRRKREQALEQIERALRASADIEILMTP